MPKIFGTDGVRGKANVHPITAEFALKLGQALAEVFVTSTATAATRAPRVVIGRDTRRSGPMLQYSLAGGLSASGLDVTMLPPLPTPAVAHLVRTTDACCGVMLTASHNPACDNGFKVFGPDGFKLDDELETRVEALILEGDHQISSDRVGRIEVLDDAPGRCVQYMQASVNHADLSGLKAVLDCANGAASAIATNILSELGVDVITTDAAPDGDNINLDCGSMHPEHMRQYVLEHGADLGIAFDGDADRVIFCDHTGTVISGDKILGLCALKLQEAGALKKNTAVVTVMSNLGLKKALEAKGIEVATVGVGDRQVLEEMGRNGYNFGGEESGHIIFRDHATTGDGILSGLQVLKILKDSGQTLKELTEFVSLYPHKLVNLMVERKLPLEELSGLQGLMSKFAEELGDNGRYLIRYSGTENKLRILVEAETADTVERWTEKFAAMAKEELSS